MRIAFRSSTPPHRSIHWMLDIRSRTKDPMVVAVVIIIDAFTVRDVALQGSSILRPMRFPYRDRCASRALTVDLGVQEIRSIAPGFREIADGRAKS